MLRRRAFVGLLFGLTVAHAEPAGPPPGPTLVAIPTGAPVALDGSVLAGEWTEAARCATSAGGPEIRSIQQRGTWILAIGTNAPWPENGHLTIYTQAGGEDGSIHSKGTVWIDLEPRDHNRPHALVKVRNDAGDGWTEVPGRVVARFADVGRRAAVEVAIEMSLLGLARAKPPPLRWIAVLTSPGGVPTYRTFPFPLDLAGRDLKALGPDLASTARWALTTDWPRADGPGAYSPDEWATLVRADAELTRLGTTAHAAALALDGSDGSGEDVAARPDAAIEDDILANLREVARLEPLTHADVRAMARALLALDRAPEAAALIEGPTLARDGRGDVDDYETLARALMASERFEGAARAYEAVAARVLPRLAPGYLGTAAWLRTIGDQYDAERKARAEDAARDDLPLARLRTSKGEILLRLLEDDVPEAVRQFVHLAEDAKDDAGRPFYAGTLFHRARAGALVEGGDPDSRTKGCAAAGTGGSPWQVAPERNPRHRCFRGAVGFSLNGQPNIRSQFFVMTGPKPEYHKTGMPIFATVVAGMDVVDRLEACDALLSVEILRKRPHSYVPTKIK